MGIRKIKPLSILVFAFFFISSDDLPRKQVVYEDNTITSRYETEQERFHGKYISYYKNGKIKSQGLFENNLRAGVWSVWDSTGKLRMKREYSDYSNFKRHVPKYSKDKVIELLNVSRFRPEYNNDGFINYPYLHEADVRWEKRLWRYVTKEDNPLLFGDDFAEQLCNLIRSKQIKIYRDDEFWTTDSLVIIEAGSKLMGYKIKEDSFFDNSRLVSETRIIGICPVIFNALEKDTLALGWIYFPQIRRFSAQWKLKPSVIPRKIKTFDDLFFYRYFYGRIYKQSTIDDKPLASYCKTKEDLQKESNRIDIEIIESEHNIWISMTK